MPAIQWGIRTRTVLDVGCGVASFGGYLLERNVITMSFAPKDEHEAQIQFALERGIPAFLAVIGTQKLLFPDNSFDAVHCARCKVHWYANGNILSHHNIVRQTTVAFIFSLFYYVQCILYFHCVFLTNLLLGMAGGKPLLELNRVLRPGGYFIWSATPVYRQEKREQDDWHGSWACPILLRTDIQHPHDFG